jgi:hypothetical protein
MSAISPRSGCEYTGKRATRQQDGSAFDDLPAETIAGDRAPPKRRSRRAARVT